MLLMFVFFRSLWSLHTADHEFLEDQELVNSPLMVKSEKLAFAFGTARRSPTRNYIQFDRNGQKINLPRGIYHFESRDSGVNARWRLPQRGESWLNTELGMKDNQRNIDGFYLQNPLLRPISVQVVTERKHEHEVEGMASEHQAELALQEAQRICLQRSERECEAALQNTTFRYYDLRASEIAQQNAPLHERLSQIGDIATSMRINSNHRNSVGVLMDVPGESSPLYFGASLGGRRTDGLDVLFQPPRPLRYPIN